MSPLAERLADVRQELEHVEEFVRAVAGLELDETGRPPD